MVRLPSRRARRLQWLLLASVVLLAAWIVANAADNLAARHLGFSFDYLWAPAHFDIPFHLIDWATTDTFGRVLLVGLLNTLLVSVAGIVAATMLGFLVGIMRLSPNWLWRQLASGFIELIRNTPQLIQIVFWYIAVLQALPGPRQSIVLLPGVLLNVRGLFVPRPIWSDQASPLLAAAVAVVLLASWAIRRRGWRWSLLLAPAVILAGLAIERVDWPQLGGFNIRGGVSLPPEFVALWFGLSIYSAAFIAEIVRGAVEAVPKGQVEAARALGLPPRRILVSVVLPQALRMMVPPLTSQYLNLFKSSSLGAAIAYPEVFQIFAGTALNQSGREIETMTLVIAVFLAVNLSVSALMNAYNARLSLDRR
jgi:general L-amino acid transport system permease protein